MSLVNRTNFVTIIVFVKKFRDTFLIMGYLNCIFKPDCNLSYELCYPLSITDQNYKKQKKIILVIQNVLVIFEF